MLVGYPPFECSSISLYSLMFVVQPSVNNTSNPWESMFFLYKNQSPSTQGEGSIFPTSTSPKFSGDEVGDFETTGADLCRLPSRLGAAP